MAVAVNEAGAAPHAAGDMLGQVMMGAAVSCTVTWKLHVLTAPHESETVHATLFVPTANEESLEGVHDMAEVRDTPLYAVADND